MGQSNLKCRQPTAKAVYDYLVRQGYAKTLDSGFRVLNYQNSTHPEGTLVGAGDGQVGCQELWENSLIILDDLGQKKEAVQKYQELRRLIETQTRRPIPWVFEAPTIGTLFQKQRELETSVHQIQQKVQGAIDALEKILAPVKEQNPAKYQHCLIACLYWFVLVSEDGKGIADGFEDFLRKQKVDQKVIHKIIDEFSKYLKNNGGGLGLANVGLDAKLEATALETVLQKNGACTEQSKVMYAVLRMAGIEAFFVEPQLSVEYFLAKNKQPSIPLLSHMASGVGVKVIDEDGKEGVWIVDVALKLLEADYIKERPGQWNAHPYWELSLRHFFMADLSNLGLDQTKLERYAEAEQNLKTALDLGEDSAAFHAMGNYANLLGIKAERMACHSKDHRKICANAEKGADEYTRKAAEINPHDPTIQFNRGQVLLYKGALAEAVDAFLQSIAVDPRYILPYQKLGITIREIQKKTSSLFALTWENLEDRMLRIVANHPKFKETIEKGLKEMQKTISLKTQAEKEIIDLIDKLRETL